MALQADSGPKIFSSFIPPVVKLEKVNVLEIFILLVFNRLFVKYQYEKNMNSVGIKTLG